MQKNTKYIRAHAEDKAFFTTTKVGFDNMYIQYHEHLRTESFMSLRGQERAALAAGLLTDGAISSSKYRECFSYALYAQEVREWTEKIGQKNTTMQVLDGPPSKSFLQSVFDKFHSTCEV